MNSSCLQTTTGQAKGETHQLVMVGKDKAKQLLNSNSGPIARIDDEHPLNNSKSPRRCSLYVPIVWHLELVALKPFQGGGGNLFRGFMVIRIHYPYPHLRRGMGQLIK